MFLLTVTSTGGRILKRSFYGTPVSQDTTGRKRVLRRVWRIIYPAGITKEMDAITDAYYSISKSHDFITELRAIRKHFQGRPTRPIFAGIFPTKLAAEST